LVESRPIWKRSLALYSEFGGDKFTDFKKISTKSRKADQLDRLKNYNFKNSETCQLREKLMYFLPLGTAKSDINERK